MGQKKFFKVRTQIDWKLFYEFNKVLHSILRPIFEPKIRIKTSNLKENIKEIERFSRFSRTIQKNIYFSNILLSQAWRFHLKF